ncbi:MAG: hypothetical protein KJ047_02130 [Anaerolineae bacterium]|nr:hypothetical protein [Anaerolineae bacterium]
MMTAVPRLTARQWLAAFLALVAALTLTACARQEKDVRLSLDERASAYEESLRAELDWLWQNRIDAASQGRPDEGRCVAPDYARVAPTMDDEARAADDLGGKIVDQLTYASQLIADSRARWEQFCAGGPTASDTVAFLDSRLNAAARSLNLAREWLDARAESRRRAGK